MPRPRGQRIRPERVAEQIRVDVADILQRELKDPRLGLVTCTRVDVTNDLRHAKIYVSILGEEAEQKSSMEALKSGTGYVRRLLTSRLGLRVSPEIVFLFDPSVEYSIRLEGLIEETKLRSPTEPSEPPEDDEGSAES
jgi:ribosome-binding factor A